MGVADPFDDRVCYLDLRLHLVRYINDTGHFANRPLEVIACDCSNPFISKPKTQLNAHTLAHFFSFRTEIGLFAGSPAHRPSRTTASTSLPATTKTKRTKSRKRKRSKSACRPSKKYRRAYKIPSAIWHRSASGSKSSYDCVFVHCVSRAHR